MGGRKSTIFRSEYGAGMLGWGPAGLLVLIGLLVSVVFASPWASGAPPTEASVAVFDQCANSDAADIPVPDADGTDCSPEGWINGILNTNNSHYSEDQVVPQRAVFDLPANGAFTGRTITIRYQARKGSVHAYDSLGTWNYTQVNADRCLGLSGANCVGGTATTSQVPSDTTLVNSSVTGCSDTTDNHELPAASRLITLYGGTITNVSAPVHDNAASGTQDDYASVTITYDVSAVPTKVMVLFGGHTAASSGIRGWVAACGSGSISGGPYHFKLAGTDGTSIGNRDNQIQGSGLETPTSSPSPTPTDTATPSPTPTDTATPSPTPTDTPTPSATPTDTATPSATPTDTPRPTPTPACSAGPSGSPSTRSPAMSLRVYCDKAKTVLHCDFGLLGRKCTFTAGWNFALEIVATGPPPRGYTGYRIVVQYKGAVNLVQQDGLAEPKSKCNLGSESKREGQYVISCKVIQPGELRTYSHYDGPLANLFFACKEGEAQIDLVANVEFGSLYTQPGFVGPVNILIQGEPKGDKQVGDSLHVNCARTETVQSSAPLPLLLYAADTDGDGCTDTREMGIDPTTGGLRDPFSPWDFYDVAGPNGTGPDGVVDLAYDVLGVIGHYASLGGPPYDSRYDRGASTGVYPWSMTKPDGVIDLPNDVLGVIKQLGHDCR